MKDVSFVSMNKSDIVSEIEYRVSRSKNSDYAGTTVGITDKPKTRKDKHANDGKSVQYWKDWSASEKDGLEIEEYFLAKGMKGDKGSGEFAGYVYIF